MAANIEVCRCDQKLCIKTLVGRREIKLDDDAYYNGPNFRDTWTMHPDCPLRVASADSKQISPRGRNSSG
jgi:hypothetical protein